MHRRGADVARLSRIDDIVERVKCLLDRRLVVPAMDLVEIEVISTETPEAGVDLLHDRLARQPMPVRSRAHSAINLGGDDDFVASGEIPDRATEDFLAAPNRIAVRRIGEIDAGFERALDEGRLSSSPRPQAWFPRSPSP